MAFVAYLVTHRAVNTPTQLPNNEVFPPILPVNQSAVNQSDANMYQVKAGVKALYRSHSGLLNSNF